MPSKQPPDRSRPDVLKQSGEATHPLCLKGNTQIKDGFVEMKFKPVSGQEDEAGRVLWRCKDADIYYIARTDALEDNVTSYRTIEARRVSFKNGNTKVAPRVRHTLSVDFEVTTLTVTFDRKKVIEATDDSFPDAGKVGLWRKADNVTLFDDFTCSS